MVTIVRLLINVELTRSFSRHHDEGTAHQQQNVSNLPMKNSGFIPLTHS